MRVGFLPGHDTIKPDEILPLEDYLREWDKNDELSLNAPGKLRKAIGPGVEIDYQKEPRFARIYPGRPMKRYKPFEWLLGGEAAIHRLVTFLEHARDGLQAERQIVSFIGPVSAGKSKVATTCLELFAGQYVWILGYKNERDVVEPSPLFEGPLGLFNSEEHGRLCEDKYHIPHTRLITSMSGWATTRFEKCGGDLSRFVALRIKPSKAKGILLATIDPDTTSVGSFVGFAGRKGSLDEYEYSGVLNRTTTGILEFAEMWNADWTPLQKFLSATEERRYVGDGPIGMLPYQGLIIAHGNEEPWNDFKDGKFGRGGSHFTKGLVDRTVTIEIPYCIRTQELAAMYERNLRESGFKDLHLAPGSLEVVAAFAAAARQKNPAESSVRLDILDGRYAGEKAKSVDDLRQESRWRDGMKGPSERVMFDLLPMIATADPEENGLDPVLALKELRKLVVRERLPDYGEPDKDAKKCSPEVIVNDVAFKRCLRIVSRAIQEAYYEDWPAYVAAKFEEYVDLIIAWAENEDFKDQHGTIVKHAEIVEKLYKFENGMALHELERHLFSGGKPPERKLGTDDVAAYRKRVGLAALRHRSTPANAGKLVWHSLPEHLCSAFEANVRLSKAEMRDRIELKERTDPEKRKEHDAFFARMCARGYTRFQAERVVTWYLEHGA